jgi:hypothetical protein
MGNTPEQVASVIGLDVPRAARVFVPREECVTNFRAAAEERDAELVEVPPGSAWSPAVDRSDGAVWEFGENLDLVYALARSLGIDDRTIREGIRKTSFDIGALGIWRYRPDGAGAPLLLVSAFAANDPKSTMLVYDRILPALGGEADRCVGLLCLRADRGDRTVQWAEALAGGLLNRFGRLWVCGLHAKALQRRLRSVDEESRVEVVRPSRPAEITRTVTSSVRGERGIVFGFGNIGGLGGELVRHWSRVGERFQEGGMS